jgi:hypothetical protein
LRLRARRWLPGPTVDGLLPGREGWSSGLGLPGRWLGGKYYIFFCLDAKETKSQGFASFLTGKSQTDDSRLQTRLGAGWVKGLRGIAWCWVFKLVWRIGSNSVSAPLGGRRLPAIFPKRCNAGGQAGSSGLGLPGVWLGGERCRWVRLSRPALSFRRACSLGWSWNTSVAGRCVSGLSHFVPTARVVG